MASRRFFPLLAAALAIGVGACTKPEEPRLQPLTVAEVSGARIWQRITQESDYDNWSNWPGHEGVQPGQSPHGKFHEVYINNTLHDALPSSTSIAPEGAIIVKENFDSNKKKVSYSVMVKVKGFNPAAGDWYWVAFDPTGKVLAEGARQSCIDCHTGMKSNDFVIIRRLDAPIAEQ